MPAPDWQRLPAWQQAQDLWGVRLHPPETARAAEIGSFAAYALPPQVLLDLDDIAARGLDEHLVSILAHEVGHHVLAPATRTDGLKIRHQMGRAVLASVARLPADLPAAAAFLANLWNDQLINVRVAALQARQVAAAGEGEPGMVTLWRRLGPGMAASPLGWVVMRAYEHLWRLAPGSLCPPEPPAVPPVAEAPVEPGRVRSETATQALERQLARLAHADPQDAALMLADTTRTFAADPVGGALAAGMLLAPFLLPPPDRGRPHGSEQDASGCAGSVGARPATAAELEAVLRDPRLQDEPAQAGDTRAADGAGQAYDLARTLALHEDAARADVLAAWYRHAAAPHVAPLLQPRPGPPGEPIPGPRTLWEAGGDLAEIDWPGSFARGPVVVPGVTTVRREEITDEPRRVPVPVEVDLYVDCSGSMRRPEQASPALVAGTVLVESVLRGGGRVRVTSFSGPGQVSGQDTFSRHRADLLRHLLHSSGGSTTFPLDLLAHRYLTGTGSGVVRRRHLVVLSDDGLASMFGAGQPASADVARQVAALLDSGTLVLAVGSSPVADVAREAGYDVVLTPRVEDAPDALASLSRRLLRTPEAIR